MAASSQPPPARALVGRDDALATLAGAALPGTVTAVVGPPGVGKTSLVAAFTAGSPVVWVDLGAAATASDLWGALVGALGLNPARSEDAAAQIPRTLAARGAPRVVLDAAEHLDAGAWDAVSALARAAPGVAWIASTVVRPPGVRVLELGPLRRADAVALLLARAGERVLDQPPDPADPAWDALAGRLDGLPLALELAAGRFGVLTAAQILERLDRPGVLAGGRHGTFTGALRYAWDLLSDADRAALAACSVFRGGFDLAAAEAVLGEDALDRLTALRARSALAWRDGRFHVLEGLRRLAEAEGGPIVAEARARHRAHYASLGRALRAVDRPAAVDLLRADHANLEAAWRAAKDVDPADAGHVALAWIATLTAQGPLWRCDELPEVPALARALNDDLGAELLAVWATQLRARGRLAEALAAADDALALAEAARWPHAAAMALSERGMIRYAQRAWDLAEPDLARAVALATDPFQAAYLLNRVSIVAYARKDLAATEAALREGAARLDGQTTTRAARLRASLRINLARLCASRRQYDEARAYTEQGLADVPAGETASRVTALLNLAMLDLAQGHDAAALERALQVAEHQRALGGTPFDGLQRRVEGIARWALGDRAAAKERFAQASVLAGADRAEAALARVWTALVDGGHPADLSAARAGLEETELAAVVDAWAAGGPLPPEPAVESFDARLARRFLRRGAPIVTVDGDGRWFERPSGRVDLARRGALRRILGALAANRRARPGVGMGVDALFEAGWPGETALPEAAAARVYTAVRELRALGLDVALKKHADGYLLDPTLEIAVVA